MADFPDQGNVAFLETIIAPTIAKRTPDSFEADFMGVSGTSKIPGFPGQARE